jgi:putative oxidoreductase
MSSSNNALILVARVLLSFIFIYSGFGKLLDPAGTAGMIAGR